MDILLFALFTFLAFFLLILYLNRNDQPTLVFAIAFFAITAFMVFTNDITFIKTNGVVNQLTSANCVSTSSTFNCSFGNTPLNATTTSVSLIDDTSIQSGIGVLYLVFAFYLIVLLIIRR